MDELVTIIIPVYNASKYITRCINSLINQTYQALQIIIIDDGSTDGSGDICKVFAEQDKRIELIHQVNSGVSAARNTGLDSLRGEWIAFVDADDYVSPYYIEDLLAITQKDCDFAICRAIWVKEDDELSAEPFERSKQARSITGMEACILNFGKEVQLFVMCWGKLFKSNLWTDLRFPDIGIGEDLYITYKLLYKAGHIAITDAKLYAYTLTSGSLSRSELSEKQLAKLDAWQEGVRFFSSMSEPNLAHIARRVYCCRTFDVQSVYKKMLPYDHAIQNYLKRRAEQAYHEAKPICNYIDCSHQKALAYRFKLFLGRWCLPLYSFIFVRDRTNI